MKSIVSDLVLTPARCHVF